jgi:hypothetical protein
VFLIRQHPIKRTSTLFNRTVGQGSFLRPNHSVGSAATRKLRRSLKEEKEEEEKNLYISINTKIPLSHTYDKNREIHLSAKNLQNQ